MEKAGVGRAVLSVVVSDRLRPAEDNYDVPGIVEQIITDHGFVDLAQLPAGEFNRIAAAYLKERPTDAS